MIARLDGSSKVTARLDASSNAIARLDSSSSSSKTLQLLYLDGGA